MQQAPVGQQIILQGNGYTYYTIEVSDVQYPPDDKVLSSDYKAMSERLPEIYHSIAILGDQKPKAANEGFKVVGSSFFTAEIPKKWEIKPVEGFPCWDIFTGNDSVGEIELIPYKNEGTNETTIDVSMMREYLCNDKAFREVRITLKPGYADKVTMGKIKTSFKFADGPYNVVDLQYAAEQYLARGGNKVFGTIKDFQMEDGKPAAVRVNVMKFLTDDTDNKYPNGFKIENSEQMETYSLDGVHIAPLAAPNYNTYGVYEMPLLDETFVKNYKNYKNFYYDFILGNDGQLKIVLAHYVP